MDSILKIIRSLGLLVVMGGSFLLPVGYGKDKKRSAPDIEDHASYFSREEATKDWKKRDQADVLRLKALSSINTMISQKINKPRKFELILRLGELYAERSDYLRAREIYTWSQRHDKWQKKKKGKEPKLSHRQSTKELRKSVDAFRKLVVAFKNHDRVDAALFSLAKTLARLKDRQCVKYFDQLISRYPNSVLIPEAYLALGEWYFDVNNISMAMKNYKKVMKYKNSPAYVYAVYKLGWAFYNVGDQNRKNYNKALSAFKLVVKISDRTKKQKGVNLRKEAINDLVMVWAELENINDAWHYFRDLEELEAFYDVLEKLGNTYADQGKFSKAISSFTRLLEEAPHRERNPTIYAKLVNLHDGAGMQDAVVQDLIAMHKLYALNKSVWIEKNKKDTELIKEAKEKVVFHMHRFGTLYHQRGNKSNNEKNLKTALRIYQIYLSNYPKTKDSYEIRYYLADLYFHFKMFEPASDEYLKVAKKGKTGKYFKEAAKNAVVAINTLVSSKKWPKLPELGKAKKKIKIPREKLKLVNVIDTYVALLPNDKNGHPMRFSAAKVFFEYGEYQKALKRFEYIATQLPKTKEGKAALKTILSFHTDRSEWREVIGKSRKLLLVKKLQGTKQRQIVLDHLKNAMFKIGLKYESLKKHSLAAKSFVDYQKEFPKDNDSDKALFNASRNYYEVAAVDQALETDKKLIKIYPRSKLVPTVNLTIAQTYEGIADYDQAALYYAMYAKNFSRDKKAPAALFNAATLYGGLKQYELALDYYLRFVKYYTGHKIIPDAIFETAVIYEKLKKYPQSVRAFRSYLSKAKGISLDRKLFVRARAARMEYAHVSKKNGLRQLTELARYLRSNKKNPAFDARRLVAEFTFEQVQLSYKSFVSKKVRSAKTLEVDVKAKQQRLVNLASQYEKIISIGSSEYMVAALYKLGEMHELFAEDLFNAPSPKGTNQMIIDQYRSSIEKVAFPLKEEAYKYYEAAYKKASEVETFTFWTKQAYRKMADLYPEKHPEIMEQAAKPAYLSHKLIWDDTVSDLVE